ncbi:MAG: carbohydrate ABC transporter permease [Anaerolineae bacterium]|nr:carbohydrate ABC transporter permease [Anaerolineae bacterium]
MTDVPLERSLSLEHAPPVRASHSRVRQIGDALLTALGHLLIVVVFGVPMIWALSNSFRPTSVIAIEAYPVSWRTFVPTGFTLDNYISVLRINTDSVYRSPPLLHYVWISVASAGLVVFFSLVFNTMAAYFFARLKFPGKTLLLIFSIATMMIPEQVILVPMFMVAAQFRLIDTFWALVIPFYAGPFMTFALMQFITANVPYEMDEAAMIDGANRLQILWHVIVPGIIPALITMALLEFQTQWNTFYWPLIAVYKEELQPIQINLAVRGGSSGTGLATIVIASMPVIVLFLAFQRFYMKNIALTGMR